MTSAPPRTSQGVTVSSSTSRRSPPRAARSHKCRTPRASGRCPAARRSRGCTRAASPGGRDTGGAPLHRRTRRRRCRPSSRGRTGTSPTMPTRLGRRRQSEKVVAAEERLQDHVVESEGERRADDDERAFGALEREIVPGAERDDDRDADERDREPDDVPTGECDRARGSTARIRSSRARARRRAQRSRTSCAARRCSGTGDTRRR